MLEDTLVIWGGEFGRTAYSQGKLTKDTYGIHGTPDPKLVNKRASHGCVRLTNWDAQQLGAAVETGAKVRFLCEEARGE